MCVCVTLFDAGWEEEEQIVSMEAQPKQGQGGIVDGFNAIVLSPNGQSNSKANQRPKDPASALEILVNVQSMRGYARQELSLIHI